MDTFRKKGRILKKITRDRKAYKRSCFFPKDAEHLVSPCLIEGKEKKLPKHKSSSSGTNSFPDETDSSPSFNFKVYTKSILECNMALQKKRRNYIELNRVLPMPGKLLKKETEEDNNAKIDRIK